MKQLLNEITKLLPNDTATFMIKQIHFRKAIILKRNRWNLKDKLFFLTIFYHSRKAYRLLGKLFILPSRSTLLLLLSKYCIYP